MKSILIFIPIILLNLSISADNVRSKVKPMKRIEIAKLDSTGSLDTFFAYPDEYLEEMIGEQLDSLVKSWYVKNAFLINQNNNKSDQDNLVLHGFDEDYEGTSDLPDSMLIDRLQAIDAFVDLSYNKTIKSFINLYVERRRDQVEYMLGLAQYYFPKFEQILDKYNMPLELKYMAIIESALNARAVSPVGAVGLWQFMYPTGKMYGLEITTFVDERMDPIKSTEAAARYLSDLYKIYKDWHLVIAAYNCGPGNVNKAIRRSGGQRDYWKIYYRLPRETRGYVPLFISATYVMHYYREHGLEVKMPNFDIITDTIMVQEYLNLNQVANTLDLNIDLLREINPMYRRDIIPARPTKPYPLCLPQDDVNRFIDFEEHIFAYKREEYFPNNEIKNPNSTSYRYIASDIAGKDKIYYKVKSGDNLGYIAEWFRVKASSLRHWNNIRGNLIRVGQKLTIYVPQGQGEYYTNLNNLSFSQKQASLKQKPVTSSKSYSNEAPDGDGYVYYTVRRGDNLWTIARRYPGISADNIMKMNGISNSRSLRVGQRLKIKIN